MNDEPPIESDVLNDSNPHHELHQDYDPDSRVEDKKSRMARFAPFKQQIKQDRNTVFSHQTYRKSDVVDPSEIDLSLTEAEASKTMLVENKEAGITEQSVCGHCGLEPVVSGKKACVNCIKKFKKEEE